MGPERVERRSERVEQRRRRKIPLACEPCRERKSRCDGGKPICSTCQRRALPLHHCVYTLENARTASNEAYIKVLHDRIRRLEKTCADHGLPVPSLDSAGAGDGEPVQPSEQPRRLLPTLNTAPRIQEHAASPNLRAPRSEPSPDHERLDATESAASVTAMGTVSTEDDVCQAFDAANEFYGSSSAASFMKEACTSAKPHRKAHTDPSPTSVPAFSVNFARSDPIQHPQFGQADRFVLPPRRLADHLLSRFWERVYWLHPLFHKPTFLQAYESLWRPAHEQPTARSQPGLGLGSSPGADAGTIVFHSALNVVFALGAQFSDLGAKDKATAIETFFNRGKAFVGLDFIDVNNVGVVQALLLMSILLQSTPFPSRCWNAVGLASRVAQGLGLHTEAGHSSQTPLETEIRRRTWHGCVTLDMIVSMMYGRPTMTAHVPHLPLPATAEFEEAEDSVRERGTSNRHPSKMSFYAEYIRQCRILGEILSRVYTGASITTTPPSSWFDQSRAHGLDAILDLDAKLSQHETSLPPIMSWTSPCDISALDEKRRLIIETQRTVLRGNFLYLRLMLHRPILTQLCSNTEPVGSADPSATPPGGPLNAGQELFNSFAAGCARICLGAAMDLIEHVQATYLTNTTGGWWWDGLYALTAGLAVIVGYLSPPLLASLDRRRLERSWMLCQEILAHFASFSISARRSLRLLQKVHADVMSRSTDKDQELPLRAPATLAQGKTTSPGQDAAMHHMDGPLHFGGSFQWQLPTGVGPDMLDAGLLSNWDPSLDFMPGGMMDPYN